MLTSKPTRVAAVSLLLAVLLGYFYPISNFFTRAGTVLCLLISITLFTAATWRRKPVRYVFIACVVIALLAVAGPGREYSASDLRAASVRELFLYDGTRYVWGGEGRFGIDCSGLIRRALINAAFKRGLATANPRLVRVGLTIWWHDCSARDLGRGYRGSTVPVTSASNINTLPTSTLQAGDLAVTVSGVHVLAYAGGNTWVEADPNLDRVVVVHVPDRANGWFNVPVNVMRWRIFSSIAA